MPANSLRDLAKQVYDLDQRVRAKGSTGQLAHSSIEDGALQAYNRAGSQVMVIGKQWDGTYASSISNGPLPPTPTAPVISDGIGGFVAAWDGQFENAAILPMDFLRVDVHVGVSTDFIPDHGNRFGSISAPTGGSLTIGADEGTYYVKLVCWTQAGQVSASTIGVTAHSSVPATGSDGDAPTSSPTPECLSGIDAIYVRWTPIVNGDPVTYEVHISDTSGFTPDSTTKAGETQGSIFTIKALPGAAPVNPGDPDPRAFDYDTVYYVKVIAKDNDGAAAPSAEATGNVIQIPAGSLAADTITAREVVAGSFTGEEFAGEVAIFSQFKTATTGQRLEWGINGIQQYRSDNTRRLYVPPTDDEDIYIDAQIKARGLQVVGGASFEGTQNSIEKEGALRLASGVSSSSINTPQASVYYDTVRLDSGTAKTGAVGTFAFNATEVNCISWNPAGLFNAYQYKPNIGSRVWRFNLDGTYNSHSDFADYEITGETWIPGDPDGYMMFRFMPDGSGGKNGTQYYVAHGNLFNTYSRQDGTRIPSIGNNGVNIYSVEDISTTGQIRINIRTAMNPTNYGAFPAPSTTINTATTRNNTSVRPTCIFGNFAGGVGGNRFAVSETGGNANIQMFNASGTWLDDDFEFPGSTKRGLLYDGSNFWTLGTDGYLYKHTNFTWGAATSSKLWTQLTLRDSVGTTHETTPGPTGSLTMKRRANVRVTFPDLPFAGTGNPDDPDRWVFYAGRGASQPANSGMWKQSEAVDGVTQTIYSSLATSGTNPPTTNNFPGATPGEIRNDSLSLRIKGDGSGQFASVVSPIIKVGADLATGLPAATEGPRGAWCVTGTQALTAGNNTTITAWVADTTADGGGNSSEITLSSGVFTLARAGLYRVTYQVSFPSATAGSRFAQLYTGSLSSVLISRSNPSAPTGGIFNLEASKTIEFGAGGSMALLAQSAVALNLQAGAQYTYIQIEWLRAA
jgi:hypothetical protein